MFEEFLKQKHADDYIGTDDDMPEDFDRWLGDLTADDWYNLMVEFDEIHPA